MEITNYANGSNGNHSSESETPSDVSAKTPGAPDGNGPIARFLANVVGVARVDNEIACRLLDLEERHVDLLERQQAQREAEQKRNWAFLCAITTLHRADMELEAGRIDQLAHAKCVSSALRCVDMPVDDDKSAPGEYTARELAVLLGMDHRALGRLAAKNGLKRLRRYFEGGRYTKHAVEAFRELVARKA